MVDNKKTCFVISPIDQDGSEVRQRADKILRYVIAPAVEQCGFEPKRADRIPEQGLVSRQIIRHIIDADLVIADLTGYNPNVFYEIAIRHIIHKPLVQIIQKGERIPFDLSDMRTISVDHTDLDSVEDAKEELKKHIDVEMLKKPEKIESPLSGFPELDIFGNRVRPSAEMFFIQEPAFFEEKDEDFSELCVVGMNLRRFWTNCSAQFEERLSQGAHLKFLLVDPQSDAIPIIAERNLIYRDPVKLKEAIEGTIQCICALKDNQSVSDSEYSGDSKGSVDIRLLRYVPSYGLTMINPNCPSGRIRVDLYPYQAQLKDYPCFWIERETDEKWYRFFYEQFQTMWKLGIPPA